MSKRKDAQAWRCVQREQSKQAERSGLTIAHVTSPRKMIVAFGGTRERRAALRPSRGPTCFSQIVMNWPLRQGERA